MPVISRFALGGALAVAVNQVAAIRRADIQEVLLSDEAEGAGAQLVTLASNSASDEWNVYDSRGPKFTDIAQGELGDCYYLAGIAAIAQRHPDLIKKAFVNTGKLNKAGRTIFKLRFLLDGEEKLVALDDMVPMRSNRYTQPFIFAAFNDGDNAWPSLLEKGFAKLQGSYLAIRGGIEYEAFKAITQAPVDVVDMPGKEPDAIFKFITESMKNNWPMTAGSVDNDFGIPGGHAFVLMEGKVEGGSKMVRVYNPWAENRYAGSLSHRQTQSKGDYWMLLDEFMQAFDGVQRARVVANAHLTSVQVKVGAGALKFTTKTNKPFTVQLEYPSKRMMPQSCQSAFRRSMNVALRVAPASTPKQGQDGVSPWRHSLVSNLRADMPGSAGEYLVYSMADFENMAAVDHVIVNIYSEEAIGDLAVSNSLSANEVVDAMYGTCDEMKWTGGGMRFKRSQQTFKGSVLWEAVGSNDIVYIGESGLWLAPSKTSPTSYYPSFHASDLKCTSSGPSPSPSYGPSPSPSYWPTPSPSYRPTPSPSHWPTPSPSYGPSPSPSTTGDVHLFDKCSSLKWASWSFKRVGSTNVWQYESYPGAGPLFEVRMVGPEWRVVSPGDDDSRYFAKTSEIKCVGSSLAEEEVDPSFLEIAEASQEEEETRVKGHQRKENSSQVCSQTALKAALDRYRNLDNFKELEQGLEDSLFPPTMQSIGDEDADCGDSATGSQSMCDKLNQWDSISKRFGKADYTPKAFN